MPALTVTAKVALHARPAALIAARARDLPVAVYLEREGKRVPAAGLLGILSLEALAGAEVTVSAEEEPGAEQAVATIAGMIERGPV